MNAKLTLYCIFVLAGLISIVPQAYWTCLVIGLAALFFAVGMWIVALIKGRKCVE